jgi:hypothetical protein
MAGPPQGSCLDYPWIFGGHNAASLSLDHPTSMPVYAREIVLRTPSDVGW